MPEKYSKIFVNEIIVTGGVPEYTNEYIIACTHNIIIMTKIKYHNQYCFNAKTNKLCMYSCYLNAL